MTDNARDRIAVVYPVCGGIGGWGLHASSVIQDLSRQFDVTAIGPGFVSSWALSAAEARSADWIEVPTFSHDTVLRRLERRFFPGRQIARGYQSFGKAAVEHVKASPPESLYAFTHVSLESLRWAKKQGIPTFLDNPNTHILDFRDVYVAESRRYGCGRFRGHPTPPMIDRMLQEYELADHIRVCSTWSKQSMVARGVADRKISVIPLPVDTESFRPTTKENKTGPLRVSFVGSLDLRKGFVPLLRAIRQVGADAINLKLVGNTVDACSRRLLAQERRGLNVELAPGDPRPTYAWSDLFALPSLEDGFGFVVPEAMASGLPTIVTDRCGAAEWVRPNETGWIVPAGDVDALAAALREAIHRRSELPELGRAARASVEIRQARRSPESLADWVRSHLPSS